LTKDAFRKKYGILIVYDPAAQGNDRAGEDLASMASGRRRVLLEMMEESGTKIYRLSDEERDAVREGLDSLVVSDEELKAFRNRHKA
jgi:hypothetical protein